MDGSRVFLTGGGDVYLNDKKQHDGDSEMLGASPVLIAILKNSPVPMKWESTQQVFHKLAGMYSSQSEILAHLAAEAEELEKNG